ncbi:COP1 SUPPRESSOR 2-like protein [Drosera capensis]
MKNFRKRRIEEDDEPEDEEARYALEEVMLLQKQRQRKCGIPATIKPQSSHVVSKVSEKAEVDGEKEDLVLQDTFAQETAVMVEDPNMLKFVEQELAKRRGKNIKDPDQAENDLLHAEDELYKIPDHLKVKKRNSEESSTQWTTGIAEVQLPIEYKLKNIEETEAAKKLLHEKRLMGRTKAGSGTSSNPSEHQELYKNRAPDDKLLASRFEDNSNNDPAVRRMAATDEFILERFRKRERQRVMRR